MGRWSPAEYPPGYVFVGLTGLRTHLPAVNAPIKYPAGYMAAKSGTRAERPPPHPVGPSPRPRTRRSTGIRNSRHQREGLGHDRQHTADSRHEPPAPRRVPAACVRRAVLLGLRVRDYLIDAVELIATHGHRLLPDYRFDAHTGQWRHHSGPAQPPLRLTDVRFGTDGRITAPAVRHRRLGEAAPAGQLARARAVPAAGPDHLDDGPTGPPADFERVRCSRCRPSAWNKTAPVPVEPSRRKYPTGYMRGEGTSCRLSN